MWGELASHKRSLTHRPSSQGWAFRCPVIVCLFICLICRYVTGCGWGVSFSLILVCYTHSVHVPFSGIVLSISMKRLMSLAMNMLSL